MNRTFSQKLFYSFVVLCVLTALTALMGIVSLHKAIASRDRVLNVNVYALELSYRLQTDTYRQSAAIRGSILTGAPVFSSALNDATVDSRKLQAELVGLVEDAQGTAELADVRAASENFNRRLDEIQRMQGSGATLSALSHYMLTTAMPERIALEHQVDDFAAYEVSHMDRARAQSARLVRTYRNVQIGLAALALLSAAGLAWWLSHLLTGQISVAVREIQGSAAQLQTTATEQATGAREQATAMTEITTTMTELLTTSRQIADSSQRVAAFSRETAEATRAGDSAVDQAQGSLDAIRAQVDVIVAHMLELGKRSQQIGGLVAVISELAEQTNILAINANIEAAGAGDAGRRFGVVADEIRKLADRVGASARQARTMVDDVRTSINTTVMATESGSKAVDAGARDFSEVTRALEQILDLVTTANEAAREIELSTKQQSTAVEQVNVAVSNVAQVARDVETSTTEASQTASQLARLSARMAALIRRQKAHAD